MRPALHGHLLYVPTYDPYYVWGPPMWGSYPSLYYPAYGLGWGPGIDFGFWGGWGWGPNWFLGTIFVDNGFFHRHGFHRDVDHDFNSKRWAHNPEHRLGVPYPNRQLGGRFHAASAASRANFAGIGAHNPLAQPNGGRNGLQGIQSNANRQTMPANPQGFRNLSPRVSPRGGAARSFPVPPSSPPARSAPRFSPGFSGGAMRGFGGGGRVGGFPRGGGGFGGGRAFGGGGGHGGGRR